MGALEALQTLGGTRDFADSKGGGLESLHISGALESLHTTVFAHSRVARVFAHSSGTHKRPSKLQDRITRDLACKYQRHTVLVNTRA